MRHHQTDKKGFTLIELLVVISIISILAILALTNYTYFLKLGRDAKRKSDLKLIQSALEQFHADQHSYPAPAVITFGGSMTSLDGKKTYLNIIPNDPQKDIRNYSYTADPAGCDNTNCTSYCLYAKLETAIPASDPKCAPTSPYNYGISRP